MLHLALPLLQIENPPESVPGSESTETSLLEGLKTESPLESILRDYFSSLGLEGILAEAAIASTLLLVSLLVAFIAYLVARKLLVGGVGAIIRRSENRWDDLLREARVLERLVLFVPVLALSIVLPSLFSEDSSLALFVRRVTLAMIVFQGLRVVYSILDGLAGIYQTFDVAQERPVRSFLQVVKIFLGILAAILIVASLMDESPWGLLSGLGAMTAIILLIFKDSILGFVASIQLAAHDIVRIGDWVEIPKFNIDGDVVEISLTTVKIRNFDKTISTVPTHSLTGETLKNWRGMKESGGRRIKRSLSIDMNSVKFLRPEDIESFRKFTVLRDYLDARLEEIEKHNQEHGYDAEIPINGRRLTNLGTFRRYVIEYLRRHPQVNDEMTLLVRYLQPTSEGLPVEIYIFCRDQVWANYEAIQADIFDHLLAAVPQFDLRVFQVPSDRSGGWVAPQD